MNGEFTCYTMSYQIKLDDSIETGTTYTLGGASMTYTNSTDNTTTHPATTNTTASVRGVHVAHQFTVTFNPNGGKFVAGGAETTEAAQQTVDENTEIALDSITPVRDGHTLIGWAETVDGAVAFVKNKTLTVTLDKTLYAVWAVDQKGGHNSDGTDKGDGTPDADQHFCKIAYDLNGGEGTVPASTHYLENKEVIFANGNGLTKSGMAFLGWNTDNAATTALDSYTVAAADVDKTVTMYAIWGEDNKGGHNADGSDKGDGHPDAGQTFYTVSYDANGATGGTAPTDGNHYLAGDFVKAKAAGDLAKAGRNFSGWNTKADASGTACEAAATYTVNAQDATNNVITLYAQWADPTDNKGDHNSDGTDKGDGTPDADQHFCEIAYNLNGGVGTVPASTHYLVSENVIFANGNGLTKSGMAFLGWNTDKAATTALDNYKVTADNVGETVTMYAIWGEDNKGDHNADGSDKGDGIPDSTQTFFVVTFKNGDDNYVVEHVVEGKKAVKPATDPSKTGSTFNRWYNGDTAYNFDNAVNENLTLTANYTTNSTGGGGNGGGGGGGGGATIEEPSTPLSGTPVLNKTDHFAYINGYADGTVRPTGNVTRAEVATIFYRLLTDDSRKEIFKQSGDLTDVDATAWYNNAVCTLTNAGVITGYSDKTFKPDAPITRAEFATIATRFYDKATKTYDSDPYTDVATSWARQYIDHAAELGIIHGYDDGSFKPENNITRAETATLVNNVLGRTPDKDHLLSGMKTWPDNADTTAWFYTAIQEATNSHDFTKGEKDTYETWTKITAAKDWTALEKEWSKG